MQFLLRDGSISASAPTRRLLGKGSVISKRGVISNGIVIGNYSVTLCNDRAICRKIFEILSMFDSLSKDISSEICNFLSFVTKF
jgi:hypothetical protein